MKGCLIALLTDFGTGDPYVAAMKGVILSIHPGARLTDITHDIPRHDVTSAAYTVRCVAPYYPARTIFLCVVDPGVGTDRRILCLRKGKQVFIAPDNGLLNFVSDRGKSERWYSLKIPLRPGAVSPTFHGRDVCAPAAARIAAGARLSIVARAIPLLHARDLFIDIPGRRGAVVKGSVLHVDHFGNIVSNIRMPDRSRAELKLRIAGRTIRRICPAYEDGPDRSPFLIGGSNGLLEVSVKRGSAADILNVKTGDGVELRT
ncbi:MAG TPA: SAM-dependent chlorinase/fluorinase [Bacteroidota bacterium]|nr:SAM-dependent chlorinase/fluorinase [Bacteroidota bacterium]